MLQRVKEVQESDLRMVGALARNIQRVIAVTQADIDAAAAQGKAWVVKPVVKVSDPLDNLRGGTQLVIKQNSILPGQNVMRVMYIGGQAVVVGPGTSPLSLPDAAEDDILSLIAFGGTEQRNLPDSYIQRQFIYMMDGSYLLTDIVPTYGSKIEMDFQTTSIPAGNVTFFGGRAESSVGRGVQLAKVSSGLVADGFGTTTSSRYASNIQPTANTRYKFTFDNQTATLTSGGTTVFTNTFTGTEANGAALAINALNNAGEITSNTAGIYLYSFKVWNGQGELVADYVPAVQRGTVPVVGFYDTVSKTFKTATAGTFAAGGEAVPTPDAPMDIVSNNGVLKFGALGKNLFNPTKVLFGYYRDRTTGIKQQSSSNFMSSDDGYIPCLPNTTYAFVGTNKTDGTYSKYNTIYFFDSAKNYLGASPYDISQPTTGTTPNNCYYLQVRSNPLDNSTPIQDALEQFNWQLEQGSTITAYEPYQEGIYTDGTVETIAIKDDQSATVSSAVAEMLLKVGDYQDEQEIISGVVTRKCKVLVCNGTEDWYATISDGWYLTGMYCLRISDLLGENANITTNRQSPYCTHFERSTSWISVGDRAGKIQTYAGGGHNMIGLGYGTVSDANLPLFKQWLTDQYAAGTPVIVIYPLATETTETVTGQPMQTVEGDNTAEITQASLNNLELQVEYIEA